MFVLFLLPHLNLYLSSLPLQAPSSNQPISLKHCFPSGSSSCEFDFEKENDDDHHGGDEGKDDDDHVFDESEDDDHGGDEGEDDDDQVSDESENDDDYVGDDQGGDGDDEAMQPLAKCLHR